MSQIATKFILDNAVSGPKVRLANAVHLRGRNAANSADVNIVRVNASDVVEFPTVPQIASGTPSAAADVANVSYVQTYVTTQLNNWDMKLSVKAATTAAITLSAPQTIDGVSVIAGDRVLVKNQASNPANGIYVVAAGAWTRATDADAASELSAGFLVPVESGGTANGNSLWIMSSPNVATVGTDPITFTQIGTVSLPVWQKQTFTLNGTDITNQYVDLSAVARNNSVLFLVSATVQAETADYTVNYTGGAGGFTRITFAGDLATGGNAALVSGDVIRINYVS